MPVPPPEQRVANACYTAIRALNEGDTGKAQAMSNVAVAQALLVVAEALKLSEREATCAPGAVELCEAPIEAASGGVYFCLLPMGHEGCCLAHTWVKQ